MVAGGSGTDVDKGGDDVEVPADAAAVDVVVVD